MANVKSLMQIHGMVVYDDGRGDESQRKRRKGEREGGREGREREEREGLKCEKEKTEDGEKKR